MSDWIDEVAEFAKVMTRDEHRKILGMTDLSCVHCANCCITPDLKYLNKPPGKRCQYLTEENMCMMHGDNKPKPCVKFPYMSRFNWVVKFMLSPPKTAIEFCGIVKKFWIEAHNYLKLKETCITCQVCNTCQMEV